MFVMGIWQVLRPYSKSSLTLNEWRFNLSFSWVLMLFLNSWRVSIHIVRYDTNPPAIQKQHWHSREAQIEPPLIECECEWAFRIRALVLSSNHFSLMGPVVKSCIRPNPGLNFNLLFWLRIEIRNCLFQNVQKIKLPLIQTRFLEKYFHVYKQVVGKILLTQD
jgi:hypothetical protein